MCLVHKFIQVKNKQTQNENLILPISPWNKISHVMRKPVYAICEQQRHGDNGSIWTVGLERGGGESVDRRARGRGERTFKR